jgi:cytochrome P450 family 110
MWKGLINMALATAISPQTTTIKLTPWQQWHNFAEPRDMHDWLRNTHGDLAAMHFQGRDHVLVLTPESAREVFTQDPDMYDAFWKESFAGMNGQDSLWVLIGERHRKERLLFSPAVHANHYRAYGNVIREIARARFDTWQPGKTLKAVDTTMMISLDVIMRLIFGIENGMVMEEGRKLVHTLTHAAHPLIVFYPKLQRSWFPLWWPYVNAKKNLYAWMKKLLDARRANNIDVGDVMGVLMKATDELGNPVSDEHICNELLSVLTAGQMTTAVALAWSLYELGRHPAITAKLRAELDSAGPDAEPNLILTSMPYLDAIVKETIRLHPILSECARIPMEPVQIRGRTVQPGQALVVSIVSIHHNPDTYPEPDSFKPERFLERKFNNYEFLPFGGGHRRCMGAGLAEYTLRLALAEAVTHWDFETAGLDKDIRHDLAMGPKYGVPLRIIGRRTPTAIS